MSTEEISLGQIAAGA